MTAARPKSIEPGLSHRASTDAEKLATFERLIDRHSREIRVFMQRLCGHHHDAEELAQDVFVKAYRRLDGLREPAAARRWLYTIAVNHFNDWVKARKRNPLGDAADLEMHDLRLVAVDRSQEDALAVELEATMRTWIGELPERQRTVLLLHSAKGFDYGSIAEALGITVDAVKMSLFHAREKLRRRADRLLGT